MQTNNVVTWFEIPVQDMERAKGFYSAILDTEFHDDEMNGYTMAMFKHEETAVSGMLVLGGHYEPSQVGSVIYLNGGDDLNIPLDRVQANGGEVALAKTSIGDGECGHYAHFIDTEGNRVGLYSPH